MTAELTWPTEASLRSVDIHEVLPQQEPFVMISRIVLLNAVRTICETDILPDNIFVENGRFSASGLIENIAQTCAARIGYINKYMLKNSIQIGVIGAIRKMDVFDLPKVGQKISTIVEVKEEVFGMTLASAKVLQGDHILASTEMKIAVKQK